MTTERLFETLESVVNAYEKCIDLRINEELHGIKFDAYHAFGFEHYGEYNIDKDDLLELNIYQHGEMKPIDEIMDKLEEDFDIIKVYTIPEGKECLFLQYAIPDHARIGDTYIYDKLHEFVTLYKIIELPESTKLP